MLVDLKGSLVTAEDYKMYNVGADVAAVMAGFDSTNLPDGTWAELTAKYSDVVHPLDLLKDTLRKAARVQDARLINPHDQLMYTIYLSRLKSDDPSSRFATPKAGQLLFDFTTGLAVQENGALRERHLLDAMRVVRSQALGLLRTPTPQGVLCTEPTVISGFLTGRLH